MAHSDGDSAAPAPLRGIRVLSLAEQYPGPFATMVLADLGADVILVERPAGGDPTRRFSGHFTALSRNKRSISVDLKSPEGRDFLLRLADSADVLIEGFRPGVMDRLGVGAGDLRMRNADIVYTSISSFGHTGPLRDRAAHDLAVQGMAGFVKNGKPLDLPVADISSAMFAVIGILAALFERGRSGHGLAVDVGMLDALLTWRSTSLVSELNGLDPAPYPPEDPGYGVFLIGAEGRPFTLSISGEDAHWREVCEVVGRVDLAGIRTEERERRSEELAQALQLELRSVDVLEFEAELAARGVNLGRVNTADDIVRDPQIRARESVTTIEEDRGTRVVNHPIRFDGRAPRIVRPSPKLGEHTREVAREAGLSDADIDRLIDAGVLAEPRRVDA